MVLADPTGNPVFVGLFSDVDVFTFSTTFLAPFVAAAGVTYWISIQNQHGTGGEQALSYAWCTADVGDAQQNFFDAGFAPVGNSMAFDLTGCIG
jgi:hypothetical protein